MVSCSRCNESWPRDPALEVVCPTCKAAVGVRCKRPSGHPVMGPGRLHPQRDVAAMAAGKMRKCPGGESEPSAETVQPNLFEEVA